MEVAPFFRLEEVRAKEVLAEVVTAVTGWRAIAQGHNLSKPAQDRMQRAFRVAERIA